MGQNLYNFHDCGNHAPYDNKLISVLSTLWKNHIYPHFCRWETEAHLHKSFATFLSEQRCEPRLLEGLQGAAFSPEGKQRNLLNPQKTPMSLCRGRLVA